MFGEFQQAAPLSHRHDIVENFRFPLDFIFEGGCKRRVATHCRARDSYHLWMSPCFARPRSSSGGRFGATEKSKPVNLANDSVASHTAEFGRNVARGEAFGPKLLEGLH